MLNLLPIIFYSNIFISGLDLVWSLWLWKGGVPTHVLVLISQCHPHHCWVQNTIWMWLNIILIELTRNLYPLYHIDDLFIEIMNPTEKLLHHISWSHDMTMSHVTPGHIMSHDIPGWETVSRGEWLQHTLSSCIVLHLGFLILDFFMVSLTML